MTAFLMLNCCSTPLSRFTTAPLKGRLKSLSLGEVARSDGVAAKRTPRHCPLRSECDFWATDDRPYELHIFLYQPHLQSAPLEGS